MQGVELKRLFLVALITSLSGTALLAIAVLLFGSFDDTAGRILATTALLGGFSLFALPAGMLLDQERAVALAWAGITLAALGLLGTLVLVWEVVEDSDEAWRAVGGISALALGAAQMAATTSRLRPDDSLASIRLYRASIGTGVAFVLLICVALAQEIEDETFYRVLGAVAVLNLLAVLLQPFVRRLGASRERDVARQGGTGPTHSFRCTLDRLIEPLPDPGAYRAVGPGAAVVECRIPAVDFAAAVGTAIRALESGGARVTRIERDEPGAQG